MPFNFLTGGAVPFIPRSYLCGIVIPQQTIGLEWLDNVLHFSNSNNEEFWLVMRPNVYVWSSNYYTTDYLFDEDASVLEVNGIPVGYGGAFLVFTLNLNENCYRIRLSGFGPSADPPNYIDLPAETEAYWSDCVAAP